eukprot:CAMPEP_0118914400 /NCGR_PEP_ID=MMETSP1166-20130328/14770_1 /TAXON_ID=1104430 /ORGANISM="Chrysoreinhardia sp, Strain CCMP3193" /LENGTH=594 /DNA_ID=CAMNT_0006853981 /DNA_START=143 /DNA_END=1924 /DNA_ORIENTATION=-
MPSLGAKWQLDAALLSRPVDLTALVSLSQTSPSSFFEDDTLGRMVKHLLNSTDEARADKDTRLDVLTILSNLTARASGEEKEVIRMALDGVNEWFDEYLAREESRVRVDKNNDNDDTNSDNTKQKPPDFFEPELHKLMLLLVSRLYEYALKTEDLLDLVRRDKALALETVVGLLEDGETYTTELYRKQAPATGKVGQWEHKLVCRRHEKPLVLQLCRLLRGFTMPSSYFGSESESEVTDVAVEAFTTEMNLLLDITLKTRLVEKIALACHECLFAVNMGADDDDDDDAAARDGGGGEDPVVSGDDDDDDDDAPRHPRRRRSSSFKEVESEGAFADSDHRSIACVHSFLQNLYFYASNRTEEYRQHLLADTLLVPRLVLPYLDRSVQCVAELNAKAEEEAAEGRNKRDDDGELAGVIDYESLRNRTYRKPFAAKDRHDGAATESPALVQGISASLRTLVIASFRAPPTRFMLELLRRLNPTESLLRASAFVAKHEYVFALLCLLNVNMGAFDIQTKRSISNQNDDDDDNPAWRRQSPRESLSGALGGTSNLSSSGVPENDDDDDDIDVTLDEDVDDLDLSDDDDDHHHHLDDDDD